MSYANPQAIKDLLTTGGGVPFRNKIKVGTDLHFCHHDEDTWSTDVDPGDMISKATADVIRDGTILPDYTVQKAGTTEVYQVGRWQDPNGAWWCKLLDP